jgi:hypothetical protein
MPELQRIQTQAASGTIRLTQHAQQEMIEEEIFLAEVLESIATGQVLEDYAEHRRGACCLLGGTTGQGRPLHVVCTTANPVLIIITVYEPKPPRWISPTERGHENEM